MLPRIAVAGLALAFFSPMSAGAQVAPGASPSPSPAPAPTPSSVPIPFRFGTPSPASPATAPGVLFIFATGGDAPTQQKLVSLLTQKMEESESKYVHDGQTNLVWLVPQPAWQPSDYIAACIGSRQSARSNNDRVAGALIIGIDQISTYTHSAVILRDNHTILDATLFYSACDTQSKDDNPPASSAVPVPYARHVTVTKSTPPPGSSAKKGTYRGTKWLTMKKTVVTDFTYVKPTPKPTTNETPTPSPYYIQWKTNVRSKDDYARIWTPLQGIAILMSGVAAWATLTPSVTKSTNNTTVFSTPNPIPPGGVVTQSQTGNSKVTNASQFSGFAAGFLSSSLTYEGQVTGVPTTDWQTYNAALGVVNEFEDDMSCPDHTPQPAVPPQPISPSGPFRRPTPSPTPSPTAPPCLRVLSGQQVGQ